MAITDSTIFAPITDRPYCEVIARGVSLTNPGHRTLIYKEHNTTGDDMPDIEIERVREEPITWWEWFVRLIAG